MRRALLVLFAVAAGAGCDSSKGPLRPVPTPGPQIVVKGSSALSGGDDVERGERIRFAIAGTGAGTHFGPSTFLDSPAFLDLQVVAVLSSSLLEGQGMVSLAAGDGPKDIAAVTGTEIAVAPWAFTVKPPSFIDLGEIPASSDAPAKPSADAGVIDPAGDVDLYSFAPPDTGAHDLVIRLDRGSGAPGDFTPSLEVFDSKGARVASSATRCLSIRVAQSRSPLYVRVADPRHRGGPQMRYRLSAFFGLPESCLTVDPGGLVP